MKFDIAPTHFFRCICFRCLCPHRQQQWGIVVYEDTDNGGEFLKMRRRCITSVENTGMNYLACRRYATRTVSYLRHEIYLVLLVLPTCNPDGVLNNYNSKNVA